MLRLMEVFKIDDVAAGDGGYHIRRLSMRAAGDPPCGAVAVKVSVFYKRPRFINEETR